MSKASFQSGRTAFQFTGAKSDLVNHNRNDNSKKILYQGSGRTPSHLVADYGGRKNQQRLQQQNFERNNHSPEKSGSTPLQYSDVVRGISENCQATTANQPQTRGSGNQLNSLHWGQPINQALMIADIVMQVMQRNM